MTVTLLMRATAIFVVLPIAICSVGCNRSSRDNESTRVVLDDWWNVDYVKNGCQMSPGCLASPEETVRDFENELKIAFASESACHGVSLVGFTGEMVQTAIKNPAALPTDKIKETVNAKWGLLFDLDGHSNTQAGRPWNLVSGTSNVLSGSITTPSDVVQKVCKIVRGVGGVVK